MSACPGALEAREVTLLEVLDAALDRGVVVQGEATLSVADVDLVFLGLRLVLASVETMESWRGGGREAPSPPRRHTSQEAPKAPARGPRADPPPQPAAVECQPAASAADPDRVERGLAKLVLTVVELLRRLLEEQAIRRMEGGSLTEDEVERMGAVFQSLARKMEELKRVFGLEGEALEIDLGPLGRLI